MTFQNKSILMILFLAMLPLSAQTQSVSFSVGASSPEYFGGPRLWYAADFRVPIRNNLTFEMEGGYWSWSHSEERRFHLDSVRSDDFRRDLNVGVTALYVLSSKHVGVSFGGGTGAHFLRIRSSAVSSYPFPRVFERHIDHSSAEADLHLVGSMDIPLNSRFTVFIGQRTEFIRHEPNSWKAFGGIRCHF